MRNQSVSLPNGHEVDMTMEQPSMTKTQPASFHSSQNRPHSAPCNTYFLDNNQSFDDSFDTWGLDFEFSEEDLLSALSQDNKLSESYFNIEQPSSDDKRAIEMSTGLDVELLMHSGSVPSYELESTIPTNLHEVQQAEQSQKVGQDWSLIEHSILCSQYSGGTSQREEMGDKLFIHYLDEVFFIQFPFFNTPKKQCRGWLFSTLRRVKSSYYASLALSECHLRSEEQQSLPILSHGNHYHEIALREMKLQIGEVGSSNTLTSSTEIVDAIACLVQILFYEVSSFR
jgi:hypothetical protein